MTEQIATSGVLAATLEKFEGNILEVGLNLPLPECYPPGDSRMLWEGVAADIEEGVASTIGLDAIDDSNITDKFEDDKVISIEYQHRYLLSVYKGFNDYAVLWEGQE